MKKILLFLLPLMVAGCSPRAPKKEPQALCDSINAVWPIIVDDVELTKVSYTDNEYNIYLTLLENGRHSLLSLRRQHIIYYNEDVLKDDPDNPYNKFVRELGENSEPLRNTIQLFCDKIWEASGGESNQGYYPLYIIINEEHKTNDRVVLEYNYGWI